MGVSQNIVSGEIAVTDAVRSPLCVKEVIGRYHASLMNFLRQRLRIAEDAADVAQEAYIRLMQYEGSRDIQSPSSMLFRIAINIANDLGRSEQTRHVSDRCGVDEVDLVCDRSSPERQVAAEQDLARVQETIEHLPPKCRQVFLLSRLQCMTYPQIAEHCGISIKTVEKHISHALAACMSGIKS